MAQRVKQVIDVPELDTPESKAILEMVTDKSFNGSIYSSASVMHVKDGMVTFELYGDFRKCLIQTRGRGTQKYFDAQHSSTFTAEVIAALKYEAMAFYKAKNAA